MLHKYRGTCTSTCACPSIFPATPGVCFEFRLRVSENAVIATYHALLDVISGVEIVMYDGRAFWPDWNWFCHALMQIQHKDQKQRNATAVEQHIFNQRSTMSATIF